MQEKETVFQTLNTYAQGKLNGYERPVHYIVMEQLPNWYRIRTMPDFNSRPCVRGNS